MLKPKLLLLGGSHAEIPLILAAQSLGYSVVTTGNNPDDHGHKLADEYIPADYSDWELMIDIAKSIHADAVCSGCNDFAAISAAEVASHLSLGGHDSPDIARLLHHKNLFNKFAISIGLPVPELQEVNTLTEVRAFATLYGFPFLLKPPDLTGGKGISFVTDFSELDTAWNQAAQLTRSNVLVVQKFISGSNHAASVIIQDGAVVFSFIDNEHYYSNPYLVGGASYPSFLSADCQTRIVDSINHLVMNLDLVDGLLHLQFIVDALEDHYFIDVCRRSPGDLYIRFVELATDISYPKIIVQSEMGLPFSIVNKNESKRFIGRLCLMAEKIGIFRDVEDLGGNGELIEDFRLISQGTEIVNFSLQKIAIMQLGFDNSQDMIFTMNQPLNRFNVQFEKAIL